jgi:hypothetical protein
MNLFLLSALSLLPSNYETMITADAILLNKDKVIAANHYSTPNKDTKVTVPVPLGIGWRCLFTKPIFNNDQWQSSLTCSSWNGVFNVTTKVTCAANKKSEDFQVIKLVSPSNPNIIADVSIMCYTFPKAAE